MVCEITNPIKSVRDFQYTTLRQVNEQSQILGGTEFRKDKQELDTSQTATSQTEVI